MRKAGKAGVDRFRKRDLQRGMGFLNRIHELGERVPFSTCDVVNALSRCGCIERRDIGPRAIAGVDEFLAPAPEQERIIQHNLLSGSRTCNQHSEQPPRRGRNRCAGTMGHRQQYPNVI